MKLITAKSFRFSTVLSILALLWTPLPSPCVQARPFRVLLVKSDRVWQEYEQVTRVIVKSLRSSGPPIEIEETYLETEPESTAAFWSTLSDRHFDLLVTIGTSATRAAIRNAGSTPLVFTLVLDNPKPDTDPPGADASGVTLLVPLQEQLQMIRKSLPDARRIGLLYSRGNTSLYRPTTQMAEALGLRLVGREVNNEQEIPQALRTMLPEVDVVWMPPDNLVYDSRIIGFILLECYKNSVPIVASSREVAEAGTPLALGIDYEDIGRQTAELILRHLRGDSSADGLVEGPRRVILYINDYVATSLDLKIPKAIREKAVPVRSGGR